jgi:hypothetical protein
MEAVNPGSPSRHHALALDGALTCWVEMTPAFAVNRSSAMASNNSKPYEVQLIRAAGFDVSGGGWNRSAADRLRMLVLL